MLTRRALALLLLGPVLLAFLDVWSGMGIVAAGVFGLAVLAIVVDLALAPRARALSVTRAHDPYLTIGLSNDIGLRIETRATRPTQLIVRDEVPDEFELRRPILDSADVWPIEPGEAVRRGPIPVRPGQTVTLRYRVIPPRRGDYGFGAVTIRARGPLKLASRQHRYAIGATVKVFPNLLDTRKYDLLSRKGRLQELGLRRRRALGEGEFESLRDYQIDDTPRRIDWRATARRGKLTVRQLQTERSQNIVAVLDCGRLMDAPAWQEPPATLRRRMELRKLDAAVNAALMLGFVAGQRGDRVGALAFSDRVLKYIEPKTGRGQFYRLLNSLYDVQAETIESDYTRAFAYLSAQQRRRALIVVFTDLSSGLAARQLVARLAPFKQRHLTLLVTISDPSMVRLAQSTGSGEREVHERLAAQQMLEERQRLLDFVAENGILTLDVPADALSISVVNRYLDLKSRQVI